MDTLSDKRAVVVFLVFLTDIRFDMVLLIRVMMPDQHNWLVFLFDHGIVCNLFYFPESLLWLCMVRTYISYRFR